MAKVADGAKASGYQTFAALFTLLVVPREEPRPEARFGEAYQHYKRAVPRWLVRSFLEARRASKEPKEAIPDLASLACRRYDSPLLREMCCIHFYFSLFPRSL